MIDFAAAADAVARLDGEALPRHGDRQLAAQHERILQAADEQRLAAEMAREDDEWTARHSEDALDDYVIFCDHDDAEECLHFIETD